MSDILIKQNLEPNLIYLAAQRQINSELKLKRAIVRFFSLLIFLISFLVICGEFNANDEYSLLRELFCIVVAIVCFVLTFGFDEKRTIASKFQKKFDSNLFDLDYELSSQEQLIASEYAIKYYSKLGNTEKIEGWYTSAIGSKNFPSDVISCQKQNLMWTKVLKKQYIIFLFIVNLLILSSSLFFVYSFYDNESYNNQKIFYEIIIFYLCYISAFFMPLFKHFLDLFKLNKCIFLFCELKDLVGISLAKKMNIALITKIQNQIDDYRQSNLSVPDFFADGRRYILEAKSKIWVNS